MYVRLLRSQLLPSGLCAQPTSHTSPLAVRWADGGQLGRIQAVGGEARDVTEADFAPRVALDGCSSAESALRAQASTGENRALEARSPAAGDASRWGELRASS